MWSHIFGAGEGTNFLQDCFSVNARKGKRKEKRDAAFPKLYNSFQSVSANTYTPPQLSFTSGAEWKSNIDVEIRWLDIRNLQVCDYSLNKNTWLNVIYCA